MHIATVTARMLKASEENALKKGLPEPGGLKLRGDDCQAFVLGCSDCLSSHVLHVDPPLRLEHWLNDVTAPAAQPQPHGVPCCASEQALLLKPVHHCDSRLQEDMTQMSTGRKLAATASAAKSFMWTHKCGLSTISMTYTLQLRSPRCMAFPAAPLTRPFSLSQSITMTLFWEADCLELDGM